jgi:hypothetical protein
VRLPSQSCRGISMLLTGASKNVAKAWRVVPWLLMAAVFPRLLLTLLTILRLMRVVVSVLAQASGLLFRGALFVGKETCRWAAIRCVVYWPALEQRAGLWVNPK